MPATRQPATRRPAQRCADEPRRYAWHPFDGFAARYGILSSNPIIHDQPICRNDQSRPQRSIRRRQKLRKQTDGAHRFHAPAPTPVGAPLANALAYPPNMACIPHQCRHPIVQSHSRQTKWRFSLLTPLFSLLALLGGRAYSALPCAGAPPPQRPLSLDVPHRPGVNIGDRCLIEGVQPHHVPPVPEPIPLRHN